MLEIGTRIQRAERLQHPIQKIRVLLASHVLFFGDLKFERVVFPATQDFDLLLASQLVPLKHIFGTTEDSRWVQHCFTEIDCIPAICHWKAPL